MDGDQYAMSDLRQLISARTGHFSHPIDPFSGHRSSHLPHFDPIHHQYMSPPPPASHGSFAAAAPPQTSSGAAVTSLFAVDMDCGRGLYTEGGNSRWPRQETLTLLEIRSRLDSKFREANHKGPLWDEVSRIMSEEHGYQRSGKKCREKFENLYKYYKKTKEGKAGRQDGKNYRFFRQLEAIYGDPTSFPTNNNCNPPQEAPYPHNCTDIFSDQTGKATFAENHSFSISNSSHEFETSSSDNNEEYDLSAVAFMMSRSRDKNKKQLCTDDTDRPIEGFKRNRRPSGWKEKVKSFVDSQMKTIIDRQDIWMDTMARSFEQREQERVIREIEWKKQETERFDREHAMWAKERAWIEARDVALMEALKKFTGQGLDFSLSKVRQITDHRHRPVRFDEVNRAVDETEILALIQVRTGMEPGFQECGYSCDDHGVWEVVAEKMGCMGYNLTGVECKDKWENIRSSFIKMTDNNNKG